MISLFMCERMHSADGRACECCYFRYVCVCVRMSAHMCGNSKRVICVLLFLMYMLQIDDKVDINENSYGYLEYGFDKFHM
jgi:hypothetical protein